MWRCFVRLSSLLALVALLLPLSASADTSASSSESNSIPLKLEFQSRAQGISSFVIDDLGSARERGWWLDTLATVGTQFQLLGGDVQLELDLFVPTAVGEFTSVGTARGEDTFATGVDSNAAFAILVPQKLQYALKTSLGTLRIGHQTFGWGFGLLAQDGSQSNDFGWSIRNNLVERIAFGTKPFSTTENGPVWLKDVVVFAAADLVYRDDYADLWRGDQAYGASLGVKVDTPTWRAGILESFRIQEDRLDATYPGGRSDVTAFTTDAYFEVPVWSGDSNSQLVWESEAAIILGQTTRPYLDETYSDGASLLAVGAISRLRYKISSSLEAKLELGYASGDNDQRDDVYRVFSFHSDYSVGTVLFDHVMPMLTARSVDRVHDPDLIAQGPASTRFLVNQGSVRNTRYLYPVVRWQTTKDLELRAAYLLARSAGDLIDVYQSGIKGGYNHSYDGKPSKARFLGQELSASARFTLGAGDDLKTTIISEGGLFVPGKALASIQSAPVSLLRAGVELRW